MPIPFVFALFLRENCSSVFSLVVSRLPQHSAPVGGGRQTRGTGLCVYRFPGDFDVEVTIFTKMEVMEVKVIRT